MIDVVSSAARCRLSARRARSQLEAILPDFCSCRSWHRAARSERARNIKLGSLRMTDRLAFRVLLDPNLAQEPLSQKHAGYLTGIAQKKCRMNRRGGAFSGSRSNIGDANITGERAARALNMQKHVFDEKKKPSFERAGARLIPRRRSSSPSPTSCDPVQIPKAV